MWFMHCVAQRFLLRPANMRSLICVALSLYPTGHDTHYHRQTPSTLTLTLTLTITITLTLTLTLTLEA